MQWLVAAAASAVLLTIIAAPSAADAKPVKIGVLGDRSSAYADLGGKGAVIAAEMAVEELGLQAADRTKTA